MFKRQEPNRTTYVWVKDEKAQIAKTVPTKVADSLVAAKPPVQKAYRFGGEQVSFSAEEISDLRNFGEPVIRIIGFKDVKTETLPMWANLKTSTFIYPSEEEYVGSTRVFSALQHKLAKDHKIATAWFIARRNAAPQAVAVLAGDEKFDEEGEYTVSQGLWLLPLPCIDDIRINPEVLVIPAADTLTSRMRPIIQQLQLPKARYCPSKYPNPGLTFITLTTLSNF